MMQRIAFLNAVVVLACAGGPDSYEVFGDRMDAGATCAELFALRHEIDPNSSAITRINHDLRGIGCLSSASTRLSPAANQPSPSSKASTSVAQETGQSQHPDSSFTVQEYRVYRAVIDAPMSVDEAEAIRAAAERFGMALPQAREAVKKVQVVLYRNDWMGTAESEMRHASDWDTRPR